ncbi:MAG: hypothetical protein SFZ23_04440 [Planctomycetota bacterium]|nr:hypothetical protein [Planctomycetota bacterium]
MSWLMFQRSLDRVLLFAGSADARYCTAPVGMWPAHNRVSSKSKGAWPSGRFRYSHTNPHAEAGLAPGCHTTAYGCFGIHVFAVPGRSGMGVHAGRTRGEDDVAGGVTMGCIRVPANAMETINTTHAKDPLEAIVIEN